ncbi:MAG: cysteine--tRNA ligase [archaeon]
MKVYNTLTRKKENFKPIKKAQVGMYSCGPTVYWYQHIGNLRTYLFSDILKRTLMFNGYNVKHIINVTDVGHLTSDEDQGEDKIEKAAKREGKSAKEISNYYLKVFREDFKKLNILEPEIWSKATEHITEQINLIKTLEKKGFTYKTRDGIYFNTKKLKDYGKLAKLKKEKLQAGKRISLKDKKNSTDFALWKFSEKKGERQQEWKSPWGIGYPGWHLECSAMSMKYLGKQFDIHTGGIDHIQIHHTNEIAQSEAATGKKFVNYWMHAGWLLFKGEKVSKSKGGLYTINELEKQGFNPLEFRYLALTTKYRKPLNFTLDNLKKAKESYQRLKNIISEIKDDKKTNEIYLKEFESAINNDLDMPKALQILWKLVRDEKAQGKLQTIKKIEEVFALNLLKKEKVIKEEVKLKDDVKVIVYKGIKPTKELTNLINERELARDKKDWKKADELRNKMNKAGYSLEDTKKGSVVKKI